MPEALLPECAFYLDQDGHQTPLLGQDKLKFEKMADSMGVKGLRAVLITYMVVKEPVVEKKNKLN